jgi:cytochrome c553
MLKKLSWVGILMVALVFQAWAAPGNIAAGKQKSEACVACHGPDGNSTVGTWPKIAGQNARYLFEQLKAFKQGEKSGRYNAVMAPLVAGLSEQDMRDLAAYYASQKAAPGKADPKLVKLGERIYRGGDMKRRVAACIACHGPRGLGNPEAGFPRLSGQYAAYVEKQLKDYQNGTRTNGLNNIMPTIAKKMTPQEMAAVASYVEGLH